MYWVLLALFMGVLEVAWRRHPDWVIALAKGMLWGGLGVALFALVQWVFRGLALTPTDLSIMSTLYGFRGYTALALTPLIGLSAGMGMPLWFTGVLTAGAAVLNTRAVFIGLVLVVLVLWFTRKPKQALVIAVVGTLFGIIGWQVSATTSRPGIGGAEFFTSVSNNVRFGYLATSWSQFTQSPWVGNGLSALYRLQAETKGEATVCPKGGTFSPDFALCTFPQGAGYKPTIDDDTKSHTLPLDWLNEFGLLGLIFYLLWFGGLVFSPRELWPVVAAYYGMNLTWFESAYNLPFLALVAATGWANWSNRQMLSKQSAPKATQ
jgi:O-antigen ligase